MAVNSQTLTRAALNPQRIGKVLRAFRKYRGLTLVETARRCPQHEAGLTHNGRPLKVGGVMGSKRSKGAQNKRACRGRHGRSGEE